MFKYSHPGRDGCLQAVAQRIRDGEHVVVVLVWEQDVLVGYGIAAEHSDCVEIEIIDVDFYSRRSAEFCDTVELYGETFQVGVGHVVVQKLIEDVARPINVDATTDGSRYIFKSLGFEHDPQTTNPCILKLE